MNITPLRYPGGKGKTYNYVKHLVIINKCSHYIEPFAGGAEVAIKLLLNNQVKKITINDYDKSIYALWYSIIYHTKELIELIIKTPITMKEWYKQKKIQEQKENKDLSLIELGFSTLFLNRTNRSGIIKAGVIGGKNQIGNYKMDCRFNKKNIVSRIERIAKRKNDIKLYNKNASDFIKQHISKTKNALIFIDPPYYYKGASLYTNFYTPDDHIELSKIIINHMKDKKWILTYDISQTIETLYEDFRSSIYSLNYSIYKPSSGSEFIIFSENLKIGSIESYLQIQSMRL